MSNPAVFGHAQSSDQEAPPTQKEKQLNTGIVIALLLVFLVIVVVVAYFNYRMFKAAPRAYVAGEGIATLGDIFGGRR